MMFEGVLHAFWRTCHYKAQNFKQGSSFPSNITISAQFSAPFQMVLKPWCEKIWRIIWEHTRFFPMNFWVSSWIFLPFSTIFFNGLTVTYLQVPQQRKICWRRTLGPCLFPCAGLSGATWSFPKACCGNSESEESGNPWWIQYAEMYGDCEQGTVKIWEGWFYSWVHSQVPSPKSSHFFKLENRLTGWLIYG